MQQVKELCVHCGERPGQSVGRKWLCRQCDADYTIRRRYSSRVAYLMRQGRLGRCRNCGRFPGLRPRGLCDGCYNDLTVRDQYAPKRPVNAGAEMSPNRRLPSAPTRAQPGSAVKIEVLAQRVAAGEHLYHPEDKKCLPELGDDHEVPTFLRDAACCKEDEDDFLDTISA